MEIKESLADLMVRLPLQDQKDMERISLGDLEFGAARYAERATYFGSREDHWLVWRKIQDLRGLDSAKAVASLEYRSGYYYSEWAFDHGFEDEGVIAYEDHLARWFQNTNQSFPWNNKRYLDALLSRFQYKEVVEVVDRLLNYSEWNPEIEIRAARAFANMGDLSSAWHRVLKMRERFHDYGELWAQSALLHVMTGQTDQAKQCLVECAKLGVHNKNLRNDLLESLHVNLQEWEQLRRPFDLSRDVDGNRRRWHADPGGRLVPCTPNENSPHCYGGDEFRMPDCWGCGHKIRQWFLLDLNDIAPLKQRLPAWPLLPMLSCQDCCVWMHRHDYEIDFNAMEIRLVNVVGDCERYGEPVTDWPGIPRQPARVDWQEPRTEIPDDELRDIGDGDWERPQIAGFPSFTQGNLRTFCRTCRNEMPFVASMTSTGGFEPYIEINNGSGMQYYFACNDCRTFSVIAQWT